MRAVLLGGNGFIGSHLVDALLASDWDVTVVDREHERYRPARSGVRYERGEAANTGLLDAVLPGADVVFHLASTTLPQSSNDSPVLDVQSNLVDTLRILDTCVQRGVSKVVFLSSGGTVYGPVDTLPVSESHATAPICSYGIVKLTIERYLSLYRRQHGLHYAVLRPSNPFGPRQNPAGSQGAVSVFLGCAATGKPITLWGDGQIVRDYFYVEDLARAALAAAESPLAELTVNVGSGRGRSLNELVEAIRSVTGRPLRILHEPARLVDVPKLVLDTQRAAALLGWKPQVPFEEALERTWKWVREQAASA